MNDSEVILNFDRVDMNTVHNENRLSDFLVSTSSNHPVAHSSPAILNTARMEAGDCVSLTQSNFPKMVTQLTVGQIILVGLLVIVIQVM